MTIKKCVEFVGIDYIDNFCKTNGYKKYIVAHKICIILDSILKYSNIQYFYSIMENGELDGMLKAMFANSYERDMIGLFKLIYKDKYKPCYDVYNKNKTKAMRDFVTDNKLYMMSDLASFIARDGEEIGKQKYESKIQKHKENSNTSLKYYTSRGYTLEEAKIALSERQSTFSLAKCIEKHGEVEGKKVWQARQDKWLATLDAKSDEEKAEINKKKSHYINMLQYTNNSDGMLYILQLNQNLLKIGITGKSLEHRYKSKLKKVKVLATIHSTFDKVSLLEYEIKIKYFDNIAYKKDVSIDKVFGNTELLENISHSELIESIENFAKERNFEIIVQLST